MPGENYTGTPLPLKTKQETTKHLSFNKHKIPALMITDTAFFRSKTYHTVNDTIDRLNINKMVQLTDELEKMFKILYKSK